MKNEEWAVVVPWYREEQIESFLREWGVPSPRPDWLVLQQDEKREGCAVMKNRGVAEAVNRGAEIVVILDDDCFPAGGEDLPQFVGGHLRALEPQRVELYVPVTDPPSRGTPYAETSLMMPVAASMGFWTEIGDYCAPRQLTYGAGPMDCTIGPGAIYARYFSLCGMNLAFRPQEWLPWCSFIDVPRFDDIWMGWLWQKNAYERSELVGGQGHCFNTLGPSVRHSRQSNVWNNLREETQHIEANETLWRDIAVSPHTHYAELRALLPV